MDYKKHQIPEQEVRAACEDAYKESGHNAYFSNGFYAGFAYAMKKANEVTGEVLKEKLLEENTTA